MTDRKDNYEHDKENSRAAVLFVAAVLIIGSSSFLPPAFFDNALNEHSYELENSDSVVSNNRQTGRYLRAPSRF